MVGPTTTDQCGQNTEIVHIGGIFKLFSYDYRAVGWTSSKIKNSEHFGLNCFRDDKIILVVCTLLIS